jgi:hypothetical protein
MATMKNHDEYLAGKTEKQIGLPAYIEETQQ